MITDGLRAQLKWLITITAFAAGLQVFSAITGETGEFLSKTFSRIVLNYQAIVSYFWGKVSVLTGIDLTEFKNELTFSTIVMVPYAVRYKAVRLDSLVNENDKLLGFLNLTSLFFISNAFPTAKTQSWYYVISLIPLLTAFFVISTYFGQTADDDRNFLRKVTSVLCGALILLCLVYIYTQFDNISKNGRPWLTISILILSSSAYMVGLLFRAGNYYPFLVCCIFYIVIYSVNYFLHSIAPSIDAFLTSIGA